ncbi:hypothetical protein [Paenarthrobacter ureafaciens]|uniref:hypothetical protein n=1 Tax=Paenarthrobacter ureafaciens TaxID=37931 RepID=UPI001FB3FA05|nr:hypothetical protein [Paenarthrobacter ureafaciens]UOD83092.1 hypothetical protein MQZ73_09720 [Paenarthrobacter ureafaciens]WNZ02801.1 hypothetical protein PVT25_14275 [Paenarthrobacter ureafaciens]
MKSRSLSHLIGLALAPVLMLGLSACLPPGSDFNSPSPNPAPEPTSAAATAQPPAVEPTAAQPAGPAGPAAPQAEAPVVRWVPVGPVGPNDPTAGQRYLLLQQFQCDALAESVRPDSVQGAADVTVWQAAAAVCRAVQSGSEQDWLQASVAVAATPRIPQTQCLESTVAATSAAVIAQHRASPGLPIKATSPPGEACPRHLSGLTVVNEDLTAVPGQLRASGPRSGGTIVRLDGYYVRVGDILFDGEPAFPEIVSGGGDYQTMYLRIPPANGRDTLRISITDTVDISGTVTFYYEDTAPSSPPPATGPSQTPSPQPGGTQPGGTQPGGTQPAPSPSTAPSEASPTALP